MTDVWVYGLVLAECACWLNGKLTRSCGEAELLSWTTVMGGFAGGIGRGRRANCAGFLGVCGCCGHCRGLEVGVGMLKLVRVGVGDVLSWSSGLWGHPWLILNRESTA